VEENIDKSFKKIRHKSMFVIFAIDLINVYYKFNRH